MDNALAAVKPFNGDIEMALSALQTPRFLRQTTLSANEYRRKFRQIDNDIISAITSPEADAVTPLMSKIYLRLLHAPDQYVEGPGVLRFSEAIKDGKRLTAWEVLCELLSVSSATANKAIKWMAKEAIIGYFAGKNGVGLRIFLNRAASSIGIKSDFPEKKILPFSRTSPESSPASTDEVPFKESYSSLETLELNKKSAALPTVARTTYLSTESISNDISLEDSTADIRSSRQQGREQTYTKNLSPAALSELIDQVSDRLIPVLERAAMKAAAREHEHTRTWMEQRGIPKAVRVAQKEAYNVLKNCISLDSPRDRSRSELMVGASTKKNSAPRPTSEADIKEIAEICLSMFETRGQSVEATLAEISIEAGGFLSAEDAPRVRELAEAMIASNKCTRMTIC
jgi:hypothetical protein